MGKRGPAPTPTAILKLHGSWRAKGRPDAKTPPPTTKKRMPSRIAQHRFAKAFWKKNYEFLSKLGLMAGAAPLGFEEMAMTYHWMREAEQVIDRTGGETCVKRHTNQMVTHPMSDQYRKHRQDYLKMAKEFGCTPAAQSSMQLEIKDSKPKSGKERFFGKKFGTEGA